MPPAGVAEGLGRASAARSRSVNVIGLSDEARTELLSKLPVRAGATMTPELVRESIVKAVNDFDEHLTVSCHARVGETEVNVDDRRAESGHEPAAQPRRRSWPQPGAIRVGGNMQSTKLIQQPRPVYPPEAKAARIQGVVKLMAVIAKDGTVKRLEVISGHPLLVPSALDAVKNWVYQTTLLNGEPVEVQTQIDVNYTLSPVTPSRGR